MSHTNWLALLWIAVVLPLGGCSSKQHGSRADRSAVSVDAFDPLGGNYPQIMWMCNVYEVPAQTEIGADGTVRASGSMKPNGIGVVAAGDIERAFTSIRQLPNATFLGTPVSFSAPKSTVSVAPGSRDKAGSSIGERSLMLTGELIGDHVRSTVEVGVSRGSSTVSCNCGTPNVPPGGALLFLCRGPDAREPWTLLVVRPTVLRSEADFPHQRASGFAAANTP